MECGFLKSYKAKQTKNNEQELLESNKLWVIRNIKTDKYLSSDSNKTDWMYTGNIDDAIKYNSLDELQDFIDVTTITGDPEVGDWEPVQVKTEEATQASNVSGGKIGVFGAPVDTQRDVQIMEDLLENNIPTSILKQMAELNDCD